MNKTTATTKPKSLKRKDGTTFHHHDVAVITIVYAVQQMAIHSDFITPQRQPLSMTQPLRTPKEGVRRGPDPRPDEGERILGTPDYLAPEILRQEKHGTMAAWSLVMMIVCVCDLSSLSLIM